MKRLVSISSITTIGLSLFLLISCGGGGGNNSSSGNGNPPTSGGVAASYPGDVGIENDSRVVFVEQFEEVTLPDLLTRWEYNTNSARISFSSDVPSGSGGSQSALFNGSADLYTRLLPGYEQLYIRFYAKIDPGCNTIHHWPFVGGHNPSTAWPWPRAGIQPVGNERWSTAVEPMGSNWSWDFYTYWRNMRTNPGGGYWGNTFGGRPSPWPVSKGLWFAVEMMVKMNSPATAWNGEQAFWINGKKKAHLGPGFPRGEWIWDGFYPNPTCTLSGACNLNGSSTPCCQDFEGFQWRNDLALNINYIWLEHYVDTDPTCSVRFDHLVIATDYIGPMVSK